MKFIKNNAQHFAYVDELLTIDIFGALERKAPAAMDFLLDGLFVTLKIRLSDNTATAAARPTIRHNLDLFNDNQVTRLIAKVCERLEVGHSAVSKAFNEIVDRLEEDRIQFLGLNQVTPQPARLLTKEEKEEALEALRHPDLMQRTFKAFEVMGICGEAYTAMILFLAMLSRKLLEPVSVICMAVSGSGKSYLMDRIGDCIPLDEIRQYTQLTAASLYHHTKNELAGKVLLIEDLFSDKGAMVPIRALQSNKRISKTMTVKDRCGDLKAVDFVVEGPLCIIGCTTYDKVFADNANRCLVLTLDNSPEQDKRIMDYQKQLKAGLINTENIIVTQYKMVNMQKALEMKHVINPYAPLIALPKETLHPRRTLQLVLNFMDTITFYHQYQRLKVNKQTGEEYLETHPDDIKWTFELLKPVLFLKSDELSAAVRSFYQWLVLWQQDNEEKEFFAATVRENYKIHPRTLNRHLKELTEYGYLKITGGNRHTTGYSYTLHTYQGEGLNRRIEKQINDVLEKVEKEHQKRTKPDKSDKTDNARSNGTRSDKSGSKGK